MKHTGPRQRAKEAGEKWFIPDTICERCGTKSLKATGNGYCTGCGKRGTVDSKDYYMAYREERVKIAQCYGFDSIIDCAVSMYPEKSTTEIGEIFGVSKDCVNKWLQKAGVDRLPSGGANNCKFSDFEIRKIRFLSLYNTPQELAKEFQCYDVTIRKIVKREVYKWVK